MTNNGLMTVGELSRRTGVPIKNLRQYTDWGLIYTVGRSPTNYRLFDSDALWCVESIGRLRGLGLTVAEIRRLTDAYLHRGSNPIGPRLADLLHVSRKRLTTRIAELRRTVERIDHFERTHRAELSANHACWTGDPRPELDSDPGVRPYGR
ncbi:MerR family transcriptional regulator [Actinokineospora sp.]|uniref:MerR family transcriptional regulator n=1 Tax=Actinokineospora sp. TaxID=1872133 RepID=UPI003D6BA265